MRVPLELRSRDGRDAGRKTSSQLPCRSFVRPQYWWVFGGLVAVLTVLFGASLLGRGRYQRRAVFPASPPVTRLPIRGPLVRPDLAVAATVRVGGRRFASVWMTVDSGATGVTMPSEAFYALGLDALRGVTVRQEDPTGRIIIREAGLLPQLRLGELAVDDVVTAIGGGANVLGQSVLAHSPWEIDWDRGMLTLGSTAWPQTNDTVVVPLRRVGDADVVTIDMDGVPVEMVLDTGAFASMIPESVGLTKGLATRRLPPTVMHSLGGELIVRRLFSGDVRLGSLRVGKLELASVATGGKRANLGLLGLDVLSRYSVQVVPGSYLALRPRGDVRKTTVERIARWSFVPTTCEHVGCVHAKLVAAGRDAELTVTLDADLDQPIEVLLGCAGDHGDTMVPTGSSFAFGAAPDVARHVRVRLPSRARGSVSQITIREGASWFSAAGADCHALEALDVSPILAVSTDKAPVENDGELLATFWP